MREGMRKRGNEKECENRREKRGIRERGKG